MNASSRIAIPPGNAFVAVPIEEVAAEALQEPLLPQRPTAATTTAATEPANDPITGTWTVPLPRLKLLSFVTGSLVAVASQLLLSQLLWKPTHPSPEEDADAAASKSTQEVVIFSLLWSFFTCVMIFGSMAVFVNCVGRYCFRRTAVMASRKTVDPPTTTDQKTPTEGDDWDGDMFQIEAHHIVGSLLSISLIWIVVDIVQSVAKHSGGAVAQAWQVLAVPTLHQNALYLAISAAWYAAFVRCVLKKQDGNSGKKAVPAAVGSGGGLMSTYQMIAATLGLISGLCSQFLLSFVLWRDHMTKPIVENVVLFSVLWSLCSVVLTFFGCLSLRLLTLDETNRLTAERIFLRMESHFIFCSLIGICLAWILIDLIMDMREQIVPSVLMLAVSLLAFCAIVACFPEEKCLADLQQQENEMVQLHATSTRSSKVTTPSTSLHDRPVVVEQV